MPRTRSESPKQQKEPPLPTAYDQVGAAMLLVGAFLATGGSFLLYYLETRPALTYAVPILTLATLLLVWGFHRYQNHGLKSRERESKYLATLSEEAKWQRSEAHARVALRHAGHSKDQAAQLAQQQIATLKQMTAGLPPRNP